MELEKEKLLRRAGFGLSESDKTEFSKLSYKALVDALVNELQAPPPTTPDNFDPFADGEAERVWLSRMLGGKARLGEKLTLFWHGHFATSNFKVANFKLMWEQMTLFRRLGAGRFEELLCAVSKDPAMLLWLDNNTNRRSSPNENYAREVMELFCLGVGNYTESDIKEAARALSGWSCKRGRFVSQPEHHDSGSKTVFGKTGDWSAEQLVSLVASHPKCGPYVAGRLAFFFGGSQAPVGLTQQMAKEETIAEQVRLLFLSSWFRKVGPMVKSPVDYLVGALRELGVRTPPPWCPSALEGMGQALFYPPSVKGWDGGLSWLSAGSMVERLHSANRLSSRSALRFAHPQYQIH